MPQKLLKKKKQKQKAIVDFGDIQVIADAKDKDFSLDLNNSSFKSRKGQAGSRQKGVP